MTMSALYFAETEHEEKEEDAAAVLKEKKTRIVDTG
jgi:hypothetical protein